MQVEFAGGETQHRNYGDILVVRKFGHTSDTIGETYCERVFSEILGFKAGRAALPQGEHLLDREDGISPIGRYVLWPTS